jgi:hypothetical protein
MKAKKVARKTSKKTKKMLRLLIGRKAMKAVGNVGIDERILLYGVLAYFGLRFMNESGIFPAQAGAAVGAIDNTLESVKRSIGIQAPKPERHVRPVASKREHSKEAA